VITDRDLIELIEQLQSPAARSFQYEHWQGHDRPNDVPTIWDVAEPLKKAMTSHPEFTNSFSRFFLGKQISFACDYQAMNILRVAQRCGPVDALAWYRRILATKRTKMRVVAEVLRIVGTEAPYVFQWCEVAACVRIARQSQFDALETADRIGIGIRVPCGDNV